VSVIWDAIPYEQQSDHLFNPAIGKLVALWGFHSDAPRGEIPEQKAVQQIAQGAPRLTDLIVEGNRVSSRNPAVQLDFGGYAKGYALDRARALLRVAGIGAGGSGALINIGGNLIALGHKNGEAWRVGIQHPRAPRAMATLELRDGEAIGTSGDYQRYFERDGRRYSHIIDPRTGMPAQGMQSVSVLIAPGPQSGAASDAASKPLFVAGPEAWADAARRIGVSRALVVTAAGQACATPEMAARLSWEDRSAKLAVIP
jgi:thiamine biosynthesis lipoprotein